MQSFAQQASGLGGGAGSSMNGLQGSRISLISKSEIRYEGFLYNINPEENTIALRNVKMLGTENRKESHQHIPPSEQLYEFIIFRGSDIKDLTVFDVVQPQMVAPTMPQQIDPAVLNAWQAPSNPGAPSSMGLPWNSQQNRPSQWSGPSNYSQGGGGGYNGGGGVSGDYGRRNRGYGGRQHQRDDAWARDRPARPVHTGQDFVPGDRKPTSEEPEFDFEAKKLQIEKVFA
eukprot:NODE_1915_length_1357_cov_24.876147_g1734_i0.p1 GENE.NODE_1915_length_1357_cov_24.876147_g1734_i0~~NODE_1915_length_1357_cov_24.876147_g1734_i0.p1  ORF type:complete len:230 (+),score=36.41 NODE_1915_length_1357_cov_24.876147_g1734_i0:93-782(+)